MGRTGDPWWQTTKTPKGGFILGGIWLVLGSLRTIGAVGESVGWSLILGVLLTLLGAGYLVTALLLRQRQRSQAGMSD
jgi:hypothetical protein